MSINYEYLFSQIDKAKKKQKKGYIPWNSPESKKLREQQEKDQADKKRRNDEYVATHGSPGKKQVSEKLTRVAGRKRGGGKSNVGTEQKTRDTNRGRGKDNLRTIAERKEHDRMREVDEKIRAGMTAIPFGHTNERDYKNTLAEMRDAKQAQRNQDNRIARERKVAGPGETSAEFHKKIAAKKKKKKKQTKQQAANTEEEKYDYEKDESEGKSGTYDPDKDIYGTDEDKGDYKNASVWKSWLKEKTGVQPSKTKPTGKWTCPHCKHNEMLGGKGTPETFRTEMEAMRDSVPEFNADVAETGITDKTIADNVKQYIYHQKYPDIVHNSKTGKWRGHGQKDVHDYGNTQQENKAEEGIGGMNMGSQRGLGHEAGYKQGSGQSAQITEVVEEEIGNESKKKSHKCPKCESKDLVSGQHKSKKEKRGHNTKICDDCGHEWENKSGPENHEQDEGAEVKPNKQQIPPSKPGMDVVEAKSKLQSIVRSTYKKALIIKYNNIYKPANL